MKPGYVSSGVDCEVDTYKHVDGIQEVGEGFVESLGLRTGWRRRRAAMRGSGHDQERWSQLKL